MEFSKMHGLGNDFAVIDAVTQNVHVSQKLVHSLSNRRYGIGFDQLLLVEAPYHPDLDFHFRIFNATGDEVAQCGNGARCLAKFIHRKGLSNHRTLLISTQNGRLELTLLTNGMVQVNMGLPKFLPTEIPYLGHYEHIFYDIYVDKERIPCSLVSIGNPHCIVDINAVKNASIERLADGLSTHSCFPEKANVSFMEILSQDAIKLRVFERDVGETPACGSAACAAVVAGILQGRLNSHVTVHLPGGSLTIIWANTGMPVLMIGEAVHVYDGSIDI